MRQSHFGCDVRTPLNLNNLLNRFILPALRKAGIQWHGWHAFRRGLATNLYRLGVPDKTIQAILRHSNLATTMNIYVKSVSADSTAAMRLLEAALCANCAPASAPVVAPVVN
jgi:integrase